MGLRINLNTSAYATHRVLTGTDNALGKSIERLSSGFRINSAGDDPAGLIISEKLRAQTSGISMAIKNAGDAVNMVKTAEAALNEVNRLLRSMRDLAVHASNTGANDAATAQADQAQIINAIASIDKIAAETQFGNKKLLDGTAGITASVMGSKVVSGDFSNAAIALQQGDVISVDVTTVAERANVSLVDLGSATMTVTASGKFYVNGVSVSYTSGVDTAATLADKINAISSQTGAIASVEGGVVTIKSVEYGSDAKITVTSDTDYILNGNFSAVDTGVDAAATVRLSGTSTNISDTSWTAGKGLVLKDSRGNTIVLTEAAGTTSGSATDEFRVSVGTLKFQVGAFADQTRDVNISSVYTNQLGTTIASGKSVATIDVTTFEGAQEAIKILDAAISQVSNMRANLGATQKNVLESSINSLSIAKENIAASESAIRDVDMAAEVVEFTKLQILNQSGIAMLAQANQGPQALLSLLR